MIKILLNHLNFFLIHSNACVIFIKLFSYKNKNPFKTKNDNPDHKKYIPYTILVY